MPVYRNILFLLYALLLTGCVSKGHDARLRQLAIIVSSKPQEALMALDSIDAKTLDIPDRHYRDFLRLKAMEEANVAIQSDSLYILLHGYYAENDKELYPEVLYYGGIVYKDLGDYPNALKYFQDALDLLPDNTDNTVLRNKVLTLTGQLLNSLKVYHDAIPYLSDALESAIVTGDSASLSHEYQLLGTAYMHLEDYGKANSFLAEAYNYAKKLCDADAAYIQGYMAASHYHEGKIDSALILIQGVLQHINESDKDLFKAYAADIYYAAGNYDSAYIFASDIIHSPNPSFRIVGYRRILSPELRTYLHPDTITEYFDNYLESLEANNRRYDIDAISDQNSKYNYSLYKKRNVALLKSQRNLMFLLSGIILIVLILVGFLIRYRRTMAQRQANLQNALDTISALNRRLTAYENISTVETHTDTVKELHTQIDYEISRLKKLAQESEILPDNAANTEGYRIITEALRSGKVISETSPAWQYIIASVKEVSPDFENTLRRLSGNTLNEQDYQLAALIRLGFRSSQIAQIVGRVKGAVTYRRKRLCFKLFSDAVSPEDLDKVLRLI